MTSRRGLADLPRRDVGLRATVAFHESLPLGASASVVRVVDRLQALGWTINGWLPGMPQPGAADLDVLDGLSHAERPLAFSARGWREAPGPRVRARATPAYLRAFRAALLRDRPHVVHANTLLALPEAVVARRCGLPVVVHVHEVPPPTAKRRATLATAASVADVLVAVSEAVAEMLRAHAGRTPVLVVPNGVAREATPRRSASSGPPTVGTIGTVSRTKGTDVLVRAAALVVDERPDVRFVHAGHPDLHADPGLDEELASAIDALPSGAFSLLGFRPAAEVLASLDVFVSASRTDAFPLGVLEAMAAELPVVATAVGGVPEQVEDGVTGLLVPSEDPRALAGAIGCLLDDPALRVRLGAAGADRVRDRFTLGAQAAGLNRAYLTAIARRFGPPRVRRATRVAA